MGDVHTRRVMIDETLEEGKGGGLCEACGTPVPLPNCAQVAPHVGYKDEGI